MHPILFHIGNYPVRSFGVMIMLAFLAGLWLVRSRARRFGFDPNAVTDVSYTALIAGVFGARIVFILQELPYYLAHKDKLFTLQFEGLTSFGGFLFGAAAVLVWAWRKKQSVGSLLDLYAPGFLIGHIIGRVGCFLNGCCYGTVCDSHLPWATHFPDAAGGVHHPAQIYDSLMNLVALGLLLAYERRRFHPGQGAAAFMVLHGLTRFIYEFWRMGTTQEVDQGLASSTRIGTLPFTEAHVVAAIMMIVGVVGFILAGRQAKPVTASSEMQTA